MKLRVFNILDEGLSVDLANASWAINALNDLLPEVQVDPKTITGQLNIYKTGDNVSIHGSCAFKVNVVCSRCLENFAAPLELDLMRHLVPLHSSRKVELESPEDEAQELSMDDLNFSYYEGEEIDLEQFLREETLLSLPMRFVCSEDCIGLCSKCGANLQREECNCKRENPLSPFAVLMQLKKPQS